MCADDCVLYPIRSISRTSSCSMPSAETIARSFDDTDWPSRALRSTCGKKSRRAPLPGQRGTFRQGLDIFSSDHPHARSESFGRPGGASVGWESSHRGDRLGVAPKGGEGSTVAVRVSRPWDKGWHGRHRFVTAGAAPDGRDGERKA
jgi:hypothetical protein